MFILKTRYDISNVPHISGKYFLGIPADLNSIACEHKAVYTPKPADYFSYP
jgi:hypothetical protein